ncbi:MAG: cbb3-type cytochrome oxidase assembly protein CcoS [Crocinitomicaceae bacterium]|nr:cbb3-type cytochrome oxidase assembly protein CcoS [Crocinitomicaceae bacterium]
MGIIFLLLTISICLALFFLVSFIWATKSGQYDDTYGPAVRMLFDNDNDASAINDSKNEKECK